MSQAAQVRDEPVPGAVADEAKPVKRSLKAGVASLGAAAVQGACVFFMGANAIKALLGMGSVAAASGSSLLHSDAVRVPLMVVAAVGASLAL